MELKPCPFCGNTDIFFSPHSDWCFCENDKCPGSAGIEFWQSRPTEDALRSRIEELEKALHIADDEYMYATSQYYGETVPPPSSYERWLSLAAIKPPREES